MFESINLFKEIFIFSLSNLWRNKIRTILTVLGIIIGVFTVVVVVSLINGMNEGVKKQLSTLGNSIFLVRKIPFRNMTWAEYRKARRRNPDITLRDVKKIQNSCPHVAYASANEYKFAFVKYQNKKTDDTVPIVGIDPAMMMILTQGLTEGRNITRMENLHKVNICVISSDIKKELFPNISAVGQYIKINGHKFKIIGVLEREEPFLGNDKNNRIYMPINTFMKNFGHRRSISIILKATSPEDLSIAMDEVIQLLRRLHHLSSEDENDFGIAEQGTFMDIYNSVTGKSKLIMIIISSISLLVGGVGIMNIMLVAVKERTKEIGLRKAIGATYNNILHQFLLESVVLGVIGGFLGLFSGFMVVAILRKILTSIPMIVPWWSILIAFFIPVFIGIIFGIYPASKAARLDPIESLRYE